MVTSPFIFILFLFSNFFLCLTLVTIYNRDLLDRKKMKLVRLLANYAKQITGKHFAQGLVNGSATEVLYMPSWCAFLYGPMH